MRIPHEIAESIGINESSIVEITEFQDSLTMKKKKIDLTLDELLASIPDDFQYPEDVEDCVARPPLEREMI